MPRAQIDDDRIVREVVTSLTGGEPGAERAALREQMEQAAREFDSLAAETLCKALLERLTARPDDVRELETLLILGLAHPNVLQEHRIPLVQEGRRLAVLLERQGEPERAQSLLELLCGQCPEDRGLDRELAGMLRRSGSTDRLVERYLRRAEEAMREGRRKDAVRWLREVLLVDRSRRDVARMIRDLGFEQVARRKAWLLAGKVAVGIALLAALAWAEVDRERALLAQYEAIPPAMPGEVGSLRGRLAAIDEMVDANAPWIGIFAASHERAELRAAIARIGSAQAEALAVRADEENQQATQAESARIRGRLAAERGDFAVAREELEQALELAPADWPHRGRVQADVDAIVAWQAENRGRTAEVRRVSLVRRLFSGGRIREARALLAHEPSAANYAGLAHEHVRLSEMGEALRVCEEGLASFPGNAELERLADRARELALGDRTRELSRQLRESPRPALYRELCAILLESRRTTRAEELAQEWFEKTGDGQAQLVRAEARLLRFFADRRREDARLALELLDGAERLFPHDERPLRLRLSLASRAGAWREAQRVAARLLELAPGDPVLEARFRTLATMAETAPSLEQALREVERTGRLADDEPDRAVAPPSPSSIRPLLKALAAQGGVQSAIYERGSTALVQGAKGATARRAARSIREVVQKSRTAARRLGLGGASEVLLEGDFGSLLIAPAEAGSAAVWCSGEVGERHRRSLRELVGGVPADDGEEGRMIEVLEPLGCIAGVRIAVLVSPDGVPVVVRGQHAEEARGEAQSALQGENAESLAALASSWLAALTRAVAPLSWNPPQRVVLRAARGTLVMLHAPGAVLLVVLDRGASPEDLRLPMEGAVARMQRILRAARGAAAGRAERPGAPLPSAAESKGLPLVPADSSLKHSPREFPG